MSVAMPLRTVASSFRISVADMFPQPFEPVSRPGELDSEYRQANRNHDDRRPRRDNHDHSEQEYCGADNTDSNSAGQPECNVECVHLHGISRTA